jgi:hypothetical protein
VSKLRVPIFIVLTLVLVLAVGDAVFAPTPTSREPDFIDTILASKAVVAAIRIALVFAAAFVVLSVAAMAAQRRWLVRVGPVEVSGEVSDLDAGSHFLEKEIEEANRVIEDLEEKLRVHSC